MGKENGTVEHQLSLPNNEAEHVVFVATSSLRKRVIFALQIWAEHNFEEQFRPEIVDHLEVSKHNIDWQAFVKLQDPTEMMLILQKIPNGNKTVNDDAELGQVYDYRFIAIANGGEEHRLDSTIHTEAFAKAYHGVQKVVSEKDLYTYVATGRFSVIGLDGEDVVRPAGGSDFAPLTPPAVKHLSADTSVAVQQAALSKLHMGGKSLGKPRSLQGMQPGEEVFKTAYLEYLETAGLKGRVELTSTQAICILHVLAEVRDQLRRVAITPQLSSLFLSHIVEITDELAEELLHGSDPYTAGLQFFQRTAIATGRWPDLVRAVENEQPASEIAHFKTLAYILGVSFPHILLALAAQGSESIQKQEVSLIGGPELEIPPPKELHKQIGLAYAS